MSVVANLRAAGREPAAPCALALHDGSMLTVDRWLRVLPGKRLTGVGRWNGQLVLAKLFVAEHGAERHWRRECAGAEQLIARGLATPAVLAAGRLGDNGHYTLYDYLENARSPDPASLADLEPLFEQVGRLHAIGLLQADAHPGNFLLHAGRLLVIDGDAIRPVRTKEACADNLALLFAQLQPGTETALRDKLLAAYRHGNPDMAIDAARLAEAVAGARQARLADYLDKSLRDCSLFKVTRRSDRFVSVVRPEAQWLVPLLSDPDAWLEQGVPLKRGRTATLARVEIDGRPLVIKRYNIKNAAHALSRCWRPSRAWHAWLEGHRLHFLGLATPRPLALIERRFGPLRGRAWLITDYCPGESLTLRWSETTPPPAEIDAVGQLFAQLAAARISHGDLKATNLIWHAGTVSLIDLDAMRQHDTQASFVRAWRKDRARFLRNWPEDAPLRVALERLLPVVA